VAWAALIGGHPVQHQALLNHCIANQHTLREALIIDRMRVVRASWQANIDSELRVDETTIGVAYKGSAGNEIINFPRSLSLLLPILDADHDAGASWSEVEVKIEVRLPAKPDQPVTFHLYSPMLPSIVRKRINAETAKISAALPGWTVVRGRHHEKPRRVGSQPTGK
jgi:hypothetical protein